MPAELKNEQEFSKAVIIDTFGLLGYIPTLPDPYAADLGIFKGIYRIYEPIISRAVFLFTAIRQLLIGIITWADDDTPDVNFFGVIFLQIIENRCSFAGPLVFIEFISIIKTLASDSYSAKCFTPDQQ